LVSVVDSYSTTKMGTKNLVNSNEAFGCDLMTFSFKRNVDRQMTRLAFENFGSPSWPNDLAIYSIPLRVAYQFNIPLIVYGENVAYEYGGPFAKETYSAKEQIKNDVVKPIDWDWWYNHGINSEDVESIKYPPAEIVDKLEPIYLSYFYRWDGYHNYQVASRYGFKPVTHEWKRQGRLTDYYGVDAVGYHVHPWMKYPKYGHARATDVSNDWIRNGYITRNEAIELVRKYDHILDHKMLDDFLSYCGYTDREFWDIVEKFWNKDIFEKIEEVWRLKDPIYGKRTEHAPLPEIITPA